jgi:hypothetical protein
MVIFKHTQQQASTPSHGLVFICTVQYVLSSWDKMTPQNKMSQLGKAARKRRKYVTEGQNVAAREKDGVKQTEICHSQDEMSLSRLKRVDIMSL